MAIKNRNIVPPQAGLAFTLFSSIVFHELVKKASVVMVQSETKTTTNKSQITCS